MPPCAASSTNFLSPCASFASLEPRLIEPLDLAEAPLDDEPLVAPLVPPVVPCEPVFWAIALIASPTDSRATDSAVLRSGACMISPLIGDVPLPHITATQTVPGHSAISVLRWGAAALQREHARV